MVACVGVPSVSERRVASPISLRVVQMSFEKGALRELSPSTVKSGLGRLWADMRGAVVGETRDYTSGSIARAIFLLAVPMVLEMSMQSVFAVVDVFFVGRLGADPVAVVGMTDSLLTLIFGVSMGLSMATTAMVARRIGERDPAAAAETASQAIVLGVLISLAAAVPAIVFAPELLRIMGAEPHLAEIGWRFTAITLGSNITVMLLFVINAAFRGAGDAAIAMRALWLANMANIVLDPIMIFGWGFFPAMGLEGAAVATAVGRALGVLYQLRRLGIGSGGLKLTRAQVRLKPALMRRLLRISVAGMFQFLIGTASWLGVMRILATFGGAALAGYTIAVRVIVFALLPSWGMGNAAATLVGQNLGADRPDRAERSVWITGFTNMVFLGVVGVLFMLYARPVVEIFSSDGAVVAMGVDCLRIVSFSYVFLAFGMVTVQAFNGAGDTATPTAINLFCYWLVQIPLAYVLAIPVGLGPRGVFFAICVGQAVLAVTGVVCFRRGSWKKRVV